MPSDDVFVLGGLVVTNIVIYLFLFLGIQRVRRDSSLYKISSVGQAFTALEKALRASFPELPQGFTWSEGVARAKQLELKIDWAELDREVRSYEAIRYGTGEPKTIFVPSHTHFREVLKLTLSLPRRRRITIGKVWKRFVSGT
jgi:hypothetical protein